MWAGWCVKKVRRLGSLWCCVCLLSRASCRPGLQPCANSFPISLPRLPQITDHLDLGVKTGLPYIWHSKASNPFVNLKKEYKGIFWQVRLAGCSRPVWDRQQAARSFVAAR